MFAVPRTESISTVPQARRKYVPPSFPTLYFKDSILSVPGYVFEKVCIAHTYLLSGISCPRKGNTMGGYRKFDSTSGGEQLKGWFKRYRKDCARAYKRVGVSPTRSTHVRLHTVFLSTLDRRASSLARMQTSPEALSTTLRLVDFISISRSNGDCVVLLLAHPGPNLLGRYLPLSRINALLLPEPPLPRPSTSQGDVFMGEIGEISDVESTDTMDLATFLECAFLSTIFFISDTPQICHPSHPLFGESAQVS